MAGRMIGSPCAIRQEENLANSTIRSGGLARLSAMWSA